MGESDDTTCGPPASLSLHLVSSSITLAFLNLCCSDCLGVCGDVCRVTSVAEIVCFSMLCVCVEDVMDVVFSVCIVRRGAVGARVWEV